MQRSQSRCPAMRKGNLELSLLDPWYFASILHHIRSFLSRKWCLCYYVPRILSYHVNLNLRCIQQFPGWCHFVSFSFTLIICLLFVCLCLYPPCLFRFSLEMAGDSKKDKDRDRDREKSKDKDRDREKSHKDRKSDRSDRSKDKKKERERERSRERDRSHEK